MTEALSIPELENAGVDRDGAPATASPPTRDELLEGLNEPQRAAVVHQGAPLLVVAGAGRARPGC